MITINADITISKPIKKKRCHYFVTAKNIKKCGHLVIKCVGANGRGSRIVGKIGKDGVIDTLPRVMELITPAVLKKINFAVEMQLLNQKLI